MNSSAPSGSFFPSIADLVDFRLNHRIDQSAYDDFRFRNTICPKYGMTATP